MKIPPPHTGLKENSPPLSTSDVWLKLLTLHYATCKLPPGSCPVPLCRKMRTQGLLPEGLADLKQAYDNLVPRSDQKDNGTPEINEVIATPLVQPDIEVSVDMSMPADALVGQDSMGSIEAKDVHDGIDGPIASGSTTAPITPFPHEAVLAVEKLITHYYYLTFFDPKARQYPKEDIQEYSRVYDATPTPSPLKTSLIAPRSVQRHLEKQPQALERVKVIQHYKESNKEREQIEGSLDSHPLDTSIVDHCPLGLLPVKGHLEDPRVPPEKFADVNIPLGKLSTLLGQKGVDHNGDSVSITWSDLVDLGYKGGADLCTYAIHKTCMLRRLGRDPESLKKFDKGALEADYAPMFDCRITRVVSIMEGHPVIFDVSLPPLDDNTRCALVIKAYIPETCSSGELWLTLEMLSRILPHDVTQSSLRQQSPENGGGWECMDMPSVTKYMSKHLSSLVGVHSQGAKLDVYLRVDAEEKRRQEHMGKKEVLMQRNVSLQVFGL